MSNSNFNEMHKRANDAPNAFKLAQRMASALAASPKPLDGRWVFVIDAPEDQGYPVARDLLRTSLKSADKNRYFGWEIEQGRGKDKGKLYVRSPYASQDVTRPALPTHEINHHLKRIQDALSSEWVKDADGNFRHTKAFEKYGELTMGFRLHSIDPSKFRDLLCDVMPNSAVDDTRLFDPRKSERDILPPIDELPKVGVQGTRGATIGLCLTENQVNALAKAVGFRSPVRSK